MTTKNARAGKAQSRNRSPAAAPKPDDPSTWPILWRVVAPCAGSFNHDMVFIETRDEEEARNSLCALRRSWPVRIERVSCGPLPAQAASNIVLLRATNAQNPGDGRPLLAAWEAQS
jgi:hypothetical protein